MAELLPAYSQSYAETLRSHEFDFEKEVHIKRLFVYHSRDTGRSKAWFIDDQVSSFHVLCKFIKVRVGIFVFFS